jgi:hemolysin activation/secretion protein
MRHLALAALLATTTAARAQSTADYLPREVLPRGPVGEATPPETPPEPAPLAPQPGPGPSFVLRGVEIDGATTLGEAELAPLWSDLIGNPVTVGTLDALAERIGAAYRARGYVLSQAVVPAQAIADGVVRVQVVEGFVDRVAVEGGAANQQAVTQRLFAPTAADRPLRLTTLERSVLLSRDTMGAGVETVLEPSPATFGAADLTVLLEPDPLTGFGAIDNRGSRLFGAWTASAGVSAWNRLGLNERLDALVAVAPNELSLAYGEATLDVPLPSLDGTWLDGGRLELHGDISHGDPDLGESGSPEDLTVTTDESNLRAGLIVPFVRTRSQNLYGRVGLDWQHSDSVTEFAGTEDTSTDRLTVLRARLTWDIADRFGGVTLVDAAVRQGLGGLGRVEAEGPAAGNPDFTLATLGVSRLQRLAPDWSLWAEAIGQLASTVLPNSERFALGNSTIGRGFAPGNTTGDSGWGARLELRRDIAGREDAPVEAVELYAFYDYGRAYDRAAERDGMQWEELGSAGVGARIDVRPWLTLTPEIARQTVGTATDTTDPDHETRFFIGAIARF